jgi:hypothetical protein
MPREHDRIAFRMMDIDFEWDGITRELTTRPNRAAPALRMLVHGVIVECAGPGIPAAVAIRRAAEQLAQRVTGLRILDVDG